MLAGHRGDDSPVIADGVESVVAVREGMAGTLQHHVLDSVMQATVEERLELVRLRSALPVRARPVSGTIIHRHRSDQRGPSACPLQQLVQVLAGRALAIRPGHSDDGEP